MHHNRILASFFGVATTAVLVLVTDLRAAPASASATTRLRSGTLHAQLATHISSSSGSGAGSGPVAPAGANVMATAVATLAILALAFMVVTLIRRRITPA